VLRAEKRLRSTYSAAHGSLERCGIVACNVIARKKKAGECAAGLRTQKRWRAGEARPFFCDHAVPYKLRKRAEVLPELPVHIKGEFLLRAADAAPRR
jgi:hypothetical protein